MYKDNKHSGQRRQHLEDAGAPSHPEFADRCAVGTIALIMSLACAHAHAQSSPSGSNSGQTTPNPAAASSGAANSSNGGPAPAVSVSTPEAPAAPPSDPYARYEWKGLNLYLPPPADTVDGDLFGYRQKLADDYGIGYIGLSLNAAYDNVLPHYHSGPQTYIGQNTTGLSESLFIVTFDLSRYGVPDGQIAVGTSYVYTSWNPSGPRTFNLGQLTYYQTAFNKTVEIKFGLLANNVEFLNGFIGGNFAGGVFGPTGILQTETGGSDSFFPTYGINVNVHITKQFYDKVGVARSVNPLGAVEEVHLNPSGAQFTTRGSGVLVINELGYLQPAEPGSPMTWIRSGSAYNSSHYTELVNAPLTSGANYFLYLVADRQILQPSSRPEQAYRGLYIGASAEYSPSNVNLFAQYYEARIYSLGLLSSRPFDQASFVAADSVFSTSFYKALRSTGQRVHADSKAFTGSYSFHLMPGLYLNAALQYVDHPTPLFYQSGTGSALNAIVGASLFF